MLSANRTTRATIRPPIPTWHATENTSKFHPWGVVTVRTIVLCEVRNGKGLHTNGLVTWNHEVKNWVQGCSLNLHVKQRSRYQSEEDNLFWRINPNRITWKNPWAAIWPPSFTIAVNTASIAPVFQYNTQPMRGGRGGGDRKEENPDKNVSACNIVKCHNDVKSAEKTCVIHGRNGHMTGSGSIELFAGSTRLLDCSLSQNVHAM